MHRLQELITAYMAMDYFARDVIIESAKKYAEARALSSSRGKLLSLPRPLNYHPSPDRVSDPQEESLVGVGCHTVDEN